MLFFKGLLYFCEKYLIKITGLVLIISTIIISYQVIGRKVLGISIPGYDQMVIWGSIISIYLMLGLTLKEGRHLRVSIFVKRIKHTLLRGIVELINHLISIAYVSIALYATGSFMIKSKEVGSKAIMFNVPTWIVYLFISIGLLILLIFYLERIVGFVKLFLKSDRSIIDEMDKDG